VVGVWRHTLGRIVLGAVAVLGGVPSISAAQDVGIDPLPVTSPATSFDPLRLGPPADAEATRELLSPGEGSGPQVSDVVGVPGRVEAGDTSLPSVSAELVRQKSEAGLPPRGRVARGVRDVETDKSGVSGELFVVSGPKDSKSGRADR
jgi:hypothetical protein